jgi:hypothetical protein
VLALALHWWGVAIGALSFGTGLSIEWDYYGNAGNVFSK